MTLTSGEIIKNLNERLFTQSTVIETLCELLIDKNVVTHDELEELILDNIKDRKKELQKLKSTLTDDTFEVSIADELNESFEENLMEGMYFGPIGEA